jgi:hypothetical protein
MIYQEGILKIAQDLGGFSLGKADLLRRCLSGDTVLTLADGTRITLKEMESNISQWIGKQVQCLDLQTQKHSVATISNFFNNGQREIWKIKTKTGRSIKATSNHQFLCFKGWKSMDEGLSVGDRIAVPTKLPFDRICKDMSTDLIRMCAYMIGEGYLPEKNWNNSYFCNSEAWMLDDFLVCAQQEFGHKLEVSYQQAEHQPNPMGYIRFGRQACMNMLKAFWNWDSVNREKEKECLQRTALYFLQSLGMRTAGCCKFLRHTFWLLVALQGFTSLKGEKDNG